jgi:hypothetical protein
MASLDPNFHQETSSLHREHEDLLARLDQLDAALEQIVCYSECSLIWPRPIRR